MVSQIHFSLSSIQYPSTTLKIIFQCYSHSPWEEKIGSSPFPLPGSKRFPVPHHLCRFGTHLPHHLETHVPVLRTQHPSHLEFHLWRSEATSERSEARVPRVPRVLQGPAGARDSLKTTVGLMRNPTWNSWIFCVGTSEDEI